MPLFRTSLALMLCAGGLLAVQFSSTPSNAPANERHPLTGSVVNAITGEPLPKALVKFQTADGQQAAITDASGHFSFENIPDGQYGLTVEKPSFFDASVASGAPGGNGTVTVSAGNPPLTLKLTPTGAITGRVLDEAGTPVEGSLVQVFTVTIQNGRKMWLPGQAAQTDEDGSYEVDGLQAGDYRVRLNLHPVPLLSVVGTKNARTTTPSEVYPPQYYPSGEDPTAAQIISLLPGQSEQADFTVKPAAAFRLSGTVSPAPTQTFVRILDSDGNDLNLNAFVNPRNGRFTIDTVPAGTWIVTTTAFSSGEQMSAQQTVTMTGAAEVHLTLQPPLKIPIEITPAAREGGMPQLNLALTDTSRNIELGALPTSSGGGGTVRSLAFLNVIPGHYRLRASVPFGETPEPVCLDSAHSGGADILHDGLTVTTGSAPGPIEIGLRSDCASMQIKLDQPDAMVVVVPANPAFDTVVVPTGSTSQLHNLTPGDYNLYAFTDLTNLEYANPEVMGAFTPTDVTLDSGQTASVSLKVITPSRQEKAARAQ